MIIYKTTNLITGKIYIGKDSKNNPDYLGSGVYLKSSIRKYGKENFKKEIICECNSKEDLNEKEKYWINLLNSKAPTGYNLTDGGEGVINLNEEEKEKHRLATKEAMNRKEVKEKCRKNQLGKIRSEYTRMKIKKASTGRYHTKETKKKISNTESGKIVSEETKKKQRKPHGPMSEQGRINIKKSHNTPECKKKCRDAKLGTHQSRETIEKRINQIIGKPRSEETKMKIGKGNRGKIRTSEVKNKMSSDRLGKTRGPYKKRKDKNFA